MKTSFPCSTATEIHWRWNDFDRGSWLNSAILRPISQTSSIACWPHTPNVSMAAGLKSTPAQMAWYFCCFFSSAPAPEPACLLSAWTYDWRMRWGRWRLKPSLSFTESASLNPIWRHCGHRASMTLMFRVTYAPAELSVRHDISFAWLWRVCHFEPWRQDSPWCPLTATIVPHTRLCARTSRRPTAIQTVVLTMLSPMLDSGEVSIQSPESGARDVGNWVRTTSSVAASSTRSAWTF